MRFLLRSFAFLLFWLGSALPAQAAVTIVFWSHEFGNSFPHAFFSLRGIPDAGGGPVEVQYGFTAKAVTPAILFGTVGGRLDHVTPGYARGSDAQFAVVLTDAQYAQILALAAAWDDKTGDGHYNLNTRNCIHFVKEAARIAGLTGLDQPGLMKKPRSYLIAVRSANEGRVIPIGQPGKAYLATLPPLAAPPALPPAAAPPLIPAATTTAATPVIP